MPKSSNNSGSGSKRRLSESHGAAAVKDEDFDYSPIYHNSDDDMYNEDFSGRFSPEYSPSEYVGNIQKRSSSRSPPKSTVKSTKKGYGVIEQELRDFLFKEQHCGYPEQDWQRSVDRFSEDITYTYIGNDTEVKKKMPSITITISTDNNMIALVAPDGMSNLKSVRIADPQETKKTLITFNIPLALAGRKRFERATAKFNEERRLQTVREERARQQRQHREKIEWIACLEKINSLASEIVARIKAESNEDSKELRHEVKELAVKHLEESICTKLSGCKYRVFTAAGSKSASLGSKPRPFGGS